jgi:hypothetical protein
MRSALIERGLEHVEREYEWIGEGGDVYKWRLEYDGQYADAKALKSSLIF